MDCLSLGWIEMGDLDPFHVRKQRPFFQNEKPLPLDPYHVCCFVAFRIKAYRTKFKVSKFPIPHQRAPNPLRLSPRPKFSPPSFILLHIHLKHNRAHVHSPPSIHSPPNSSPFFNPTTLHPASHHLSSPSPSSLPPTFSPPTTIINQPPQHPKNHIHPYIYQPTTIR